MEGLVAESAAMTCSFLLEVKINELTVICNSDNRSDGKEVAGVGR